MSERNLEVDVDQAATERMVAVGGCSSRIEADLKVGALIDAGIRSRVAADDAGGNDPAMAFLYCGAYRVMVPEHDRDDARELLAELDRGDHAITAVDDRPLLASPRRRRWGWLVGALIVVFAVFRVFESAFSFGWL